MNLQWENSDEMQTHLSGCVSKPYMLNAHCNIVHIAIPAQNNTKISDIFFARIQETELLASSANAVANEYAIAIQKSPKVRRILFGLR